MTEPDAEAAPAPRRSALRSPVMRSILLAEGISSFGSQVTFIALPWFVLVTSGSATRMGLVFAVELLPVALLGLPSALVVQRLGVRRSMFTSDLLRGPVLAAVPVLYGLDRLTFPVLLVIVFALGVFSSPYVSAQRLLIPETFGEDEAMVVQGNGLLEGVIRLATLIGPAAAGGLISAMGAVNVLYVDAASYLLSFAILFTGLPKPRASLASAASGEGRGVFAGARFVLAQPLLRRVTLAALVFGLFFPPLLASLPVLTAERYSADPMVSGFLFAAWGAGAVIGTFGVMRFATRMAPVRMGAFAAIGVALPLWALALPLEHWQFGLLLAVSGVFTPMLNAPVITLIMLRAPEDVRTQVITFVMTANLLAGPAGYALAGPALDTLGITPVLLTVAAGTSVAAALMLSLISVDKQAGAQTQSGDEKRLDQAPEETPAPAS
jgi:predicted MFS family arabinose efflux permease